jgi:simple sugar transport system substrate-binding protein/ribose transport system substrate-binding protein
MGKRAVEAIDIIVVKKQPTTSVTSGPYLFLDAVLVDGHNVKEFMEN